MLLTINRSAFAQQSHLNCPKRGVYGGSRRTFFDEEAAVEGLAKGLFEDNILQSKDLSQICLPKQNGPKYSLFKKKQKNFIFSLLEIKK